MENIKNITSGKTEPLFQVRTIRQRKIVEWLSAQGITREEISAVELKAPGLVRLTNPAGQYMDVLCNANGEVSISQVTQEREAELQYCFWGETNEPETQEWREDLTKEESVLVEQWDEAVDEGLASMCRGFLVKDPPADTNGSPKQLDQLVSDCKRHIAEGRNAAPPVPKKIPQLER